MLDIALDELPRRGPQQVLTRDLGAHRGERHAILELVAEAVRSARLIKRRAGPNTARERLIEKPAIQHDVHRTVGCFDLDLVEDVIPVTADLRPHDVEIGRAVV
jgi:hypothetical protein